LKFVLHWIVTSVLLEPPRNDEVAGQVKSRHPERLKAREDPEILYTGKMLKVFWIATSVLLESPRNDNIAVILSHAKANHSSS
jgi:hypothetical protein